MKKMLLFTLILAAAFTSVYADVTQESVTQLKFTGALGTIMRLVGGNKPINSTVYLQGDVHRTDNYDPKGRLADSQIINLDQEVFISLDHQKKRYTQMTFDEWRNMMQESMDKAGQNSKESQDRKDEENVDVKFSIDVQKTGEKQTIAGLNAEKVILILTIESQSQVEGQQEPQKSRLIVTSTQWLAPSAKGQDEMAQFSKKLMDKLGFSPSNMGMQQMMTQIMQNNPQLGEAMEKLQQEGDKLQGLAVKTNTVYETESDKPASQAEPEEESTEIPTSVGGLLGGLGKKMAQPSQKESGPAVLMESESEITKLETSPVDVSLFSVPEKYKEVKAK